MAADWGITELTSFLPGTITQIYGEAASGKTNLCLIAAAETARMGKKVLFVDTEGSFSPQRFRQIAGPDSAELLKNVVIAEPADFDEQKIVVNKIEDMAAQGDVGLVVIDSLVSLYRLEMGTSEEAQMTNRELSKQLAKLMKVAKKHKIPVVITNQVYATFSRDGAETRVVPVGRDVLKYWTKVVIQLAKDGQLRVATIIRHNFRPEGEHVRFRITEGGIKDESTAHTAAREV